MSTWGLSYSTNSPASVIQSAAKIAGQMSSSINLLYNCDVTEASHCSVHERVKFKQVRQAGESVIKSFTLPSIIWSYLQLEPL